MNDNEDMDAPLTRRDLREELARFATKEDLARFAAKVELQYATKDDFSRLETMVRGLADELISMGRRHEADLQRLHVELLRFIQSSLEGRRAS